MDLNKVKIQKFFDECSDTHRAYIDGLVALSDYLAFIGQHGYFCRGVTNLKDNGLALCIGHKDDDMFEPNTDFYIPAVIMEPFETKAPQEYVFH